MHNQNNIKAIPTQQNQRIRKQKQVKQKIQQIMNSVKEEKQHIENKLATNQHKIHLYVQEYQKLVTCFLQKRERNDFSKLKQEEKVVLKQLVRGLEENGIDGRVVIGGEEVGLADDVWKELIGAGGGIEGDKYKTLQEDKDKIQQKHNNKERRKHKDLSPQQIIQIQTMLIDKLSHQLKQRRSLQHQN